MKTHPIITEFKDALRHSGETETQEQWLARVESIYLTSLRSLLERVENKVNNKRQTVILETGHVHEVVFGVDLNDIFSEQRATLEKMKGELV